MTLKKFTLSAVLLVVSSCSLAPTKPQSPAPTARSYLDQPFELRTLLKSQWDPADPVGIMAEPCVAARFHNQAEKVLRDFFELCHYEQENTALPAATRQRVVFFGDSITLNWGRDDKVLFQGDRLNRGIAGQTTAQMLGRFKADVLDLKPRAVHILAGTNDIAGNTGPTSLKRMQDNMTAMIELAAGDHIPVIVGSIFPVKTYDWNPAVEPRPSIRAINEWLKNYSKQKKLIYVDYFTVLADPDGGMNQLFSDDGVHPNNRGYEAIRPLVLKALRAAGLKQD